MSTTSPRQVLITGATGGQGRPTVTAALARGLRVRALVLDPDEEASRALAAQGAEIVRGTFEDAASLDRAMAGVHGVFSLQVAAPEKGLLHQEALLAAAQRAGVEQMVQSTVSSTGLHETFPGWGEGRWPRWYWEDKAQQEARVRSGGFPHWTIVRPAMMMDNFLPARAAMMHPELLTTGELITVTRPDVPIAYVSSRTIGAAAAAALAEPARFHGTVMELADERVSLAQIARILSEVTAVPVTVVSLPLSEAVAHGIHAATASSQDWLNVVGYAANPAMLGHHGLSPVPFRRWAEEHANELRVGHQAR